MKSKKRSKQRGSTSRACSPQTNRMTVVGAMTTVLQTTTPFCAYRGSNGTMCPITTGLAVVVSLPSTPPAIFTACPLHYQFVYEHTKLLREQFPSGE